MKNLKVLQPLSGSYPASRFQAAKAMAFTLALADPELLAWKDRIHGKLEEADRLPLDEWSSELT